MLGTAFGLKTLASAARWLHVALPRADRGPRRVELDLPGQLEQQLVGYPVRANSLFLKRGLIPSWSKPTLVIRDQRILSPTEADPVAPGDYLYLLAPPEKAEALDRFFVDMAPSSAPDPHLLGDFMVSGEHTLGELAEIYGVKVDETQAKLTLADYFDIHLDQAPKEGAELVRDAAGLELTLDPTNDHRDGTYKYSDYLQFFPTSAIYGDTLGCPYLAVLCKVALSGGTGITTCDLLATFHPR